MIYGLAQLAQTSSMRSFQDCQIPLISILIMFAVLVVITFAGDGIARWVREKVVSNILKMKPARSRSGGGNTAAVDLRQRAVKEKRARGANAGKAAKKKERFRATRI